MKKSINTWKVSLRLSKNCLNIFRNRAERERYCKNIKITETPSPTETPAIYPDTVLYYNPSGGEYYHLDQNCKRINERYLPLQGHFKYSELTNDKYSKLKPCAICGAPSAGQ